MRGGVGVLPLPYLHSPSINREQGGGVLHAGLGLHARRSVGSPEDCPEANLELVGLRKRLEGYSLLSLLVLVLLSVPVPFPLSIPFLLVPERCESRPPKDSLTEIMRSGRFILAL